MICGLLTASFLSVNVFKQLDVSIHQLFGFLASKTLGRLALIRLTAIHKPGRTTKYRSGDGKIIRNSGLPVPDMRLCRLCVAEACCCRLLIGSWHWEQTEPCQKLINSVQVQFLFLPTFHFLLWESSWLSLEVGQEFFPACLIGLSGVFTYPRLAFGCGGFIFFLSSLSSKSI